VMDIALWDEGLYCSASLNMSTTVVCIIFNLEKKSVSWFCGESLSVSVNLWCHPYILRPFYNDSKLKYIRWFHLILVSFLRKNDAIQHFFISYFVQGQTSQPFLQSIPRSGSVRRLHSLLNTA
jgi:hypothetical protein